MNRDIEEDIAVATVPELQGAVTRPEPLTPGALRELEDRELAERILAGDEPAFTVLIERYYGSMLRLARGFMGSEASAEEAVQEAWVGVLRGLPRFEGRSALKTWIFRILVNRCITRRKKEGRSIPFSALTSSDDEDRAVDPSSFGDRGGWVALPEPWEKDTPERVLLRQEMLGQVERALEDLPERQRLVVTMRDVQGFSSEDVCNALDISESNQRVLLHRGRARIRRALDTHLAAATRTTAP